MIMSPPKINLSNIIKYYMHRYVSQTSQSQVAAATALINRILQNKQQQIPFTENELREILIAARYILSEQPIMLELEAPLKIIGGIHGHFSDLVNIFKMSGYPGDVSYLFLGDYIDKGPMSLQCITLLLCYKIKFPENVFLLRGHHQISSVNRFQRFYDECKERVGLKIWKGFNQIFNMMPLCAIIERKIFCVHGGISPELDSLEQISKQTRPLDVSSNGIVLDLLWSDPQPYISGWQDNQRGVSFVYGYDATLSFLRNYKFDLIVRSHQIVENGYEFLFNRQLVTIFSAPNFMGQYENYGAVMAVEQDLKCSFQIIKPKFKHRKEAIRKASPFKK